MTKKQLIGLIENNCLSKELRSYDPYDVWMTKTGILIKALFNRNKYLGIMPAAAITIWDHFLNNKSRLFYKKREYPIVRAQAIMALLNLYSKYKKEVYLKVAKTHIDWLIANSCKGFAGHCWGLGFEWAAGEDLDYNENTPFTTHTPYVLEAIHNYIQITGNLEYVTYIHSIFKFYEKDVEVIFEDETRLATSYGPSKDRLVTNAVSYTMYAYAIFLDYFPDKRQTLNKNVERLYNFVKGEQRKDGSWLYSPQDESSFIDCFHSCFILKNIYKTNKIVPLSNAEQVIARGYDYLKLNLYDSGNGLFKRFGISNKPSLIKYDLYDNAEVLHLAVLLGDMEFAKELSGYIAQNFIKGEDIYSVIDVLKLKKNRNTLRWAQMPFLYALSAFNSNEI